MGTEQIMRAARAALRDTRTDGERAIDGAAAALVPLVCLGPEGLPDTPAIAGWTISQRIRAGVATAEEVFAVDESPNLIELARRLIDSYDEGDDIDAAVWNLRELVRQLGGES